MGRVTAWYNEIDPFKAAVLREASKAGAIAPGDVDERSIADIDPAELMGYTQCHFFAGGGFWSLALRLAGWPDDRPAWTGSCPCPSFSAAGKGGGFDDPRHLWPDWERLIGQCRPATVFGEQADDAIGYGWLDLVQTDLEAQAYAVGKIVLGTCSVGGADIRQRLYFVADAEEAERRRTAGKEHKGRRPAEDRGSIVAEFMGDTAQRGFRVGGDEAQPGRGGYADSAERPRELGNAIGPRLEGLCGDGRDGNQPGRDGAIETRPTTAAREFSRLAHPDGGQSRLGDLQQGGEHGQQPEDGGTVRVDDSESFGCGNGRVSGQRLIFGPAGSVRDEDRPGERLAGFWDRADFVYCRDKDRPRWRPVESGTFPLAHGDPCRLGRLRLYGDAINVEVATAFVKAYLESEGETE